MKIFEKTKVGRRRIVKVLGIVLFSYEHAEHSRFKCFKNRIRVAICERRFKKVIQRIRNRPQGQKIRVLFIVSESAKWKCQKVYEEMDQSGIYEPIIGISAWNRLSEDICPNIETLERELLRVEAFFDKIGDRHVRTVRIENGRRKYLSFALFKPDIVYINEPWGPTSGIQFTENISKYALTVYTPYFVPNYIPNVERLAHMPFHRFLYAYFCHNNYCAQLFSESYRQEPCTTKFIATGHPSLDYFNVAQCEGSENIVIYAPHYSFEHPKQEPLPFPISTFHWNGKEILEYARQHQEIKWVFKPHPILRYALKNTGFLDADEYYDAWSKVGTVVEGGDYQDLFLKSHAMITDSASFLTEYGATGKPLIHLLNANNVEQFAMPEERAVCDTYYKVRNLEEMRSIFRIVLEEGRDPNKEIRQDAAKAAGWMQSCASKNILEYFSKVLNGI